MKYRIVKRGNDFVVQERALLSWRDVQSIAEMTIEHSSEKEAKEAIERYEQQDEVLE